MIDSKDYFAALEPKPTPKVEVLAADLAELHEAIKGLNGVRSGVAAKCGITYLNSLVNKQQEIKPRV